MIKRFAVFSDQMNRRFLAILCLALEFVSIDELTLIWSTLGCFGDTNCRCHSICGFYTQTFSVVYSERKTLVAEHPMPLITKISHCSKKIFSPNLHNIRDKESFGTREKRKCSSELFFAFVQLNILVFCMVFQCVPYYSFVTYSVP